MVELVDTPDSKSCVLRDVPVQVRLAAPNVNERTIAYRLGGFLLGDRVLIKIMEHAFADMTCRRFEE
jgi:hypothetical protein